MSGRLPQWTQDWGRGKCQGWCPSGRRTRVWGDARDSAPVDAGLEYGGMSGSVPWRTQDSGGRCGETVPLKGTEFWCCEDVTDSLQEEQSRVVAAERRLRVTWRLNLTPAQAVTLGACGCHLMWQKTLCRCD